MAKYNLSHITLNALKEEEFIVDKLIERTVPESASYLVSIYPLELTNNILNSHNDRFSFIGRVRAIFEKYKVYGLLLNFEQHGKGIRYQFYCEVVNSNFRDYQYALKAEIKKRDIRVAKQQLIINQEKNEFSFKSKTGTVKKDTFTPGTNEYAILMYLVEHLRQKSTSGQLSDQLVKDQRQHSNPDPKDRAKDVIKAIRDKLGKDAILRDKEGYYIDCEIVRV